MSIETLILDTNVLWNLDLCHLLTEKIEKGSLRVCIPTLVHAERIRQVADRYGRQFSVDVVRQFIQDTRFEILPLTVGNAEAVADVWLELKSEGLDEDYWGKHRFDIVLCAIARSTGYTLVTAEVRGRHFDVVASRMSIGELESQLLGG